MNYSGLRERMEHFYDAMGPDGRVERDTRTFRYRESDIGVVVKTIKNEVAQRILERDGRLGVRVDPKPGAARHIDAWAKSRLNSGSMMVLDDLAMRGEMIHLEDWFHILRLYNETADLGAEPVDGVRSVLNLRSGSMGMLVPARLDGPLVDEDFEGLDGDLDALKAKLPTLQEKLLALNSAAFAADEGMKPFQGVHRELFAEGVPHYSGKLGESLKKLAEGLNFVQTHSLPVDPRFLDALLDSDGDYEFELLHDEVDGLKLEGDLASLRIGDLVCGFSYQYPWESLDRDLYRNRNDLFAMKVVRSTRGPDGWEVVIAGEHMGFVSIAGRRDLDPVKERISFAWKIEGDVTGEEVKFYARVNDGEWEELNSKVEGKPEKSKFVQFLRVVPKS